MGPRIPSVSHTEAVPRDQATSGAGLNPCGVRESGTVLRDIRSVACSKKMVGVSENMGSFHLEGKHNLVQMPICP